MAKTTDQSCNMYFKTRIYIKDKLYLIRRKFFIKRINLDSVVKQMVKNVPFLSCCDTKHLF